MKAARIPHIDKKVRIRSELLNAAKAKPLRTVTYGKFGQRVDISTRGPWKPILCHVAQEETASGLPDITFLIVQDEVSKPNWVQDRQAAICDSMGSCKGRTEKIVTKYNPGVIDPFDQ